MSPASPWWPVVASSGVLSLALLGDALIYAVLPVHAATFGVSLGWVGVLLSVNRFVRVFAYGWVAWLTRKAGLRTTCIGAALTATVSTAMYGLVEGAHWLLVARVLWGLSYAALVLVTLAYAVQQRAQAGTRIGFSRSIQRVGPIAALLVGAWLTGVFGAREVFVVLALASALALPLAFSLPADAPAAVHSPRTPSLGRPRPMDALFFVLGIGVDGVFAFSITLILARQYELSVAVLSAGALLAMRHVSEAVAAPLFGALADRHGSARVFSAAAVMTSVGFAAVAIGLTVAGALLMLVFRGALAALGPATVVQSTADGDEVVTPLARMQAWRDLGAAIGPLATGYAVALVSPESMHAVLALLTLLALVVWRRSAPVLPPRCAVDS